MFSVISVMSYPMIGVDVLMYSTEGKSETSYPMTMILLSVVACMQFTAKFPIKYVSLFLLSTISMPESYNIELAFKVLSIFMCGNLAFS